MKISQILCTEDAKPNRPRHHVELPPIQQLSIPEHSSPIIPQLTSPARSQSKWSSDEDAKVIKLRNAGMKWEDVAKELPGRSDMACRLHYQNYLEKRAYWDDDLKNRLAYCYERCKKEMWSKIAEELGIPWKNAEAMHWQIGNQELALRAGVTPFHLSRESSVASPTDHRYSSAGSTGYMTDSSVGSNPAYVTYMYSPSPQYECHATQAPYQVMTSAPYPVAPIAVTYTKEGDRPGSSSGRKEKQRRRR